MEIKEQDLTCEQGTNFNERVEVSDASGGVNLADRTYIGTVRAKPGGIQLATFTFDMGDQAQNPGVFFIQLSKAVTKALPVLPSPEGLLLQSAFVYSINAVYPNGRQDSFMRGRFLVNPSV